MGHYMFYPAGLDTPDQFLCTECPFPCRTPDIDAFGVQHQDPCMAAGEGLAEPVKTHLIIGRDKNGVLSAGIPKGI